MKVHTDKFFMAMTGGCVHHAFVNDATLSTRVANLLHNMGIRTLGQLLTWSSQDLKRFGLDHHLAVYEAAAFGCRQRTGFGEVSLTELESKLASLGFKLRPVENPHAKPHNRWLSFASVNCTGSNKPGFSTLFDMHWMNHLIEDPEGYAAKFKAWIQHGHDPERKKRAEEKAKKQAEEKAQLKVLREGERARTVLRRRVEVVG